jgi:hypothetical protein
MSLEATATTIRLEGRASEMNLWKRLVARRQRKAHQRYLTERDRQRGLAREDAQDAGQKVAFWSSKGQQGRWGS